ncbi:MAG: hypothetical protein Q8R76_04395 [Candidatus Omnitrophota bacterium]|nr:hypothetical protein [Candidatus Omnitrophota bacterium]
MKNDIHEIIRKGILAPSADNLQPWLFKIGADNLELWLDAKRSENFCDAGYLAPYISIGAVIENMRIAAADRGYRMTCSYFPDKKNKTRVVTISFEKGEKETSPLLPFIGKRRTNRKFYASRPSVAPAAKASLEETVCEEGFRLHWVAKDESRYQDLCSMIGDADQLRFENQRLHREFNNILRFTKPAISGGDGLDIKTLESGPTGPLLFKLMGQWSRQKFLNNLGISRVFNAYAKIQMQSSAAAGLITAPSHAPEDYVRGGELMERLWLEATRQGLSLQPMEALPIFIINRQLRNLSDFSEAQKATIERLTANFFSLFGINNKDGLIFLFRIGHAKPTTTQALRRPIDSFLMNSADTGVKYVVS